MAETPGTRYGHYRLVAPIGTGGFATVYRAVDERLDAEVALKVLAENHALDADIRERFVTEAQLLRRVEGDAVVPVHDVGETPRGQPYIVLSFADRGDLRNRVQDRRAAQVALAEHDVRPVADTLFRALSAVHSAGLVHRDVKPDNLLIYSSGGGAETTALLDAGERLLLSDLGYAKDLAASSGLTVGGGTEGFNAPEQRVGLNRVDFRADIYGASAVLYWLLLGHAPATDGEARAEAIGSSRLSPAMGRGLARGLAEEPDDRFDSMGRWFQALGVAELGTADTSRRQESLASNTRHDASSQPRRLSAAVAGAGLAVGLAVGALGYAALAGGEDDAPTTEIIDDGRTRVSNSGAGMQLAVFGADTVAVGQTLNLEAAVVGAQSYYWVLPDGSVRLGEPSVAVDVAQAGPARATLVGRHADGQTLTIDFPFVVGDGA